MSSLVVSGDTSGSVTIAAPAVAGSGTLTLPTTSGTILTSASTINAITSGTAQASTSGTSIDFTGIPSGVKRVTVMFAGVSTNGTSKVLIQLGDSGGIETSGYLGSTAFADSSSAAANFSSGFFDEGTNAAAVRHGAIIISQVDASAFSYVCFGNIGRSDSAVICVMGGSKALSAALDRVRITTVNGTDTFDAGTINILYES